MLLYSIFNVNGPKKDSPHSGLSFFFSSFQEAQFNRAIFEKTF
jgi:hypothetical protein